MKNQYYKKDKKAQIYKKQKGHTNEYSDYVSGGFKPIAPSPLWCYTSQLSQSDIFYAKTYGEQETRFFVFNNKHDINVYDMVLYKNTWYRITRVDTKDDYNGDLFVYVQLAIGGWIPGKDEILPYSE